jgi:hypothetical protein
MMSMMETESMFSYMESARESGAGEERGDIRCPSGEVQR